MDRKEKIKLLRLEGKTIPEICTILNISKGTVGYYLKDYKHIKPLSKKGQHLIKEHGGEIIDLYLNNVSIKNITEKFGVSHTLIKKILIEKNIYKPKNRKMNIKALLEGKIQYNNPYNGALNTTIKKYLINQKLKEWKCEICNIEKWNEKEIILELDHIDGNRNNNYLSNLRLICPNCHSQTDTWKKKNKNN